MDGDIQLSNFWISLLFRVFLCRMSLLGVLLIVCLLSLLKQRSFKIEDAAGRVNYLTPHYDFRTSPIFLLSSKWTDLVNLQALFAGR